MVGAARRVRRSGAARPVARHADRRGACAHRPLPLRARPSHQPRDPRSRAPHPEPVLRGAAGTMAVPDQPPRPARDRLARLAAPVQRVAHGGARRLPGQPGARARGRRREPAARTPLARSRGALLRAGRGARVARGPGGAARPAIPRVLDPEGVLRQGARARPGPFRCRVSGSTCRRRPASGSASPRPSTTTRRDGSSRSTVSGRTTSWRPPSIGRAPPGCASGTTKSRRRRAGADLASASAGLDSRGYAADFWMRRPSCPATQTCPFESTPMPWGSVNWPRSEGIRGGLLDAPALPLGDADVSVRVDADAVGQRGPAAVQGDTRRNFWMRRPSCSAT